MTDLQIFMAIVAVTLVMFGPLLTIVLTPVFSLTKKLLIIIKDS
jgi:hypothetical protein